MGHRGLIWPNITCSHFVADCKMLPQHISVLFTHSFSHLFQSLLSTTVYRGTQKYLPQHQLPTLLLNELQNEVRPQNSERQQGTQFGVGLLELWKKKMICVKRLFSIDYFQIRLNISRTLYKLTSPKATDGSCNTQ